MEQMESFGFYLRPSELCLRQQTRADEHLRDGAYISAYDYLSICEEPNITKS